MLKIFVFQNLGLMLAGPTLLLTSDIIRERLGASALDMWVSADHQNTNPNSLKQLCL